ncbi:MAG: tRNA (adenosine(37)-N6)-threonylcarbamoyltransferase complex dimerization subunit type 1 TsaB, partial [Acidimicrobiia bacterium]
TPQASVALGSEQGIIASAAISTGSTTGEFLLPAIDFLLDQAHLSMNSIAAMAVGLGPGLFTGLRIGVTTAKTLAQALAVPIVGQSSLDLLAFDGRYSSRLICPVLDARRGEVFYCFYRQTPGGVERVGDYSVGPPRRLMAEIQGIGSEVLLMGYGALLNRHELQETSRAEFGSLADAFPRASALLALALPRLFREDFDSVFEIEPMYMRRSTAAIPWVQRGTKRKAG